MNYLMDGQQFFQAVYEQLELLLVPSKDNDWRPKFLQSNTLCYLVVLLLCVKIITICLFVPFPKNIFFADITKVDLVNILNTNRQKLGLEPLVENKALDQAALLKAQDMVQKGYFSHQSPQGTTPWFWFNKVGYRYAYAGENLAVGFVNSNEVFNAWLASPSHKENLFNPHYHDVGTSVVSGFGNDAMVVVQLFGSKAKNGAPITQKVPVIAAQTQVETESQKENSVSQNTAIDQKVLGSADQISQLSKEDLHVPAHAMYGKFIHFVVYDYQTIIHAVAYGLMLAIGMSLLINVVSNATMQRGQVIARALLLMLMLAVVLYLDPKMLGLIIPHRIII